ncbi:hypothetical protein ACFXDH_25440 [Streptomyces sp. NPDC059467]|uniref:hypothetical protein n=1 Tax=Streptomyces sp. NPDC059467 TaxID=3346844 RepID=UPI0036C8056B
MVTVSAPDHVIEVVLSDVTAEEHASSLDCGTAGRWEPLVIPPDEPAGTASPAVRGRRSVEPAVGSAHLGTCRGRPRPGEHRGPARPMMK